MLEGQIRLQIGAMEYAAGNLDEAIPELRRSSARPWDGRALLGCAYYKQKDDDQMTRAFEQAVSAGKKDGLSWTVYAWCLSSRGKRDEALAVLERGLKVLPSDERIQANVEALRENKKMKVAPYGERWSQFMLDGSVPGVPKAQRGFAQRPGFRQRPLRNKNRRA
jgi:tetratricopeptide (TPR) repeat protein